MINLFKKLYILAKTLFYCFYKIANNRQGDFMKLTKIINSVQSKIKTAKIVRHENRINKHFKVHTNTLYGDAGAQMYQAREVIARFAERNGVSVDVYDARRLLDRDEFVSPVIENDFSDKMHVAVTNLLNNKTENRIVSANTDIVYPKESRRKILIPVRGEQDLQIPGESVRYTEDTFLRNLYRNIEEMVKRVTKPSKK